MIKLLFFLLMGLASSSYAGSWVDLGSIANLTDDKDDTAAFRKAVSMAGNGGTIYISGECYLDSPIYILDRSISIIGDGVGASIIHCRSQAGSTTLNLISSSTRRGGCQWEFSDLAIQASREGIGVALSVQDERGRGNGSTLYMNKAPVISSRRDFFKNGIELGGLSKVHIENVVSPGRNEFQSNSAIRIVNKSCGKVTVADSWFLNVANCIQLDKGCRMLKLRRTNFVKCKNNVLQANGVNVENFIMMNCYNQIAETMDVRPSIFTHITSGRFITKNDVLTTIIETNLTAPTLISTSFIKRGALVMKSGAHGMIVGSGFEDRNRGNEGPLRIQNASHVREYANNVEIIANLNVTDFKVTRMENAP